MTDPALEYRHLVSDIVTAARRRDAMVAAATATRADGERALCRDIAAADGAVHRANEAVAARELELLRVDQQAEHVWAELCELRRRAGQLPQPQGPGGDPAELLTSAASRVARARQRTISGQALALLPVIGGGCAAVVALMASGLHLLGLPLSWLLFLVAPFAGLPLAGLFLDHWDGTRLRAGAVGLTVLGGMLATLLAALTALTLR